MSERDEPVLPELRIVNILLVNPANQIILQERDDKPNISNPNMFSLWGGAVEDYDNSWDEAAARELEEETGITLDPNELHLFREYRTKRVGSLVLKINRLYVVYGRDEKTLVVNEGQGYGLFDAAAVIKSKRCTHFTKMAVYDHDQETRDFSTAA